MGLQTSGAISLNQIHVEAGGSSGTLCSINDSDIRGLLNPTPGSGTQMDFADWYGASAGPTFKGAITDEEDRFYSLSFNFSTLSPAVGDLVLLAIATDLSIKTNQISFSGMSLTRLNPAGESKSPGLYVGYGFYASGGATTITMSGSSARPAAGVCAVFSGLSTFKNSAYASGSGTYPNPPNLPSASPTKIIIATGHQDDDAVDLIAPSGYTLAGRAKAIFSTQTSNRASCAVAYKITNISQAEDPGQFTNSGNLTDSVEGYTIRFA